MMSIMTGEGNIIYMYNRYNKYRLNLTFSKL